MAAERRKLRQAQRERQLGNSFLKLISSKMLDLIGLVNIECFV